MEESVSENDSDSSIAEIESESSDSSVIEELNLKDNLNFIKKQIESGEFVCSAENCPTSSNSTVWKKFNIIKDVRKKINLNFVQCVSCKKILSYSSKSGTSHLLRHNCQKNIIEDEHSNKITNFFQKKNACDSATINTIKKELTVTLVKYCAGDLRPFESVAGSGFELLANKFIEIGSKHGKVDANKIIPDPIRLLFQEIYWTRKKNC